MGIFNATGEKHVSDSISKVSFGIHLNDYATKKQFKTIKRELESYLHKNKELDNKMNRALDMGGNEIINLGNPDKPSDAVSKRFVSRKIQDVIANYELGDIKTIKELLKTESETIVELTKDLRQNEKIIVDLQGKIEEEMFILSKAMKELGEKSDTAFDEIKVVFKENITMIGKQIKELNENMIKHEDLKDKLDKAEKKLQNMYQLEIKSEITKLNKETEKKNRDLLNLFLSKHAELKAELEKSASKRGDVQDAELEQTVYNFDNKLKALQESFRNRLDFVIEKSVTHGESIKSTNNRIDLIDNLIDDFKSFKEVATKRDDDLGKTLLNALDKLSELDEVAYEVPLFELYSNRQQEVSILSASIGIATLYGSKDNTLSQTLRTSNFFGLFGLSTSTSANYKDYIQMNYKFDMKKLGNVEGFLIEKGGKFHIKIKLIIKIISGDIEMFQLKWVAGEDNWGPDKWGNILIEKKINNGEVIFEKKIKQKFLRGMSFVICPKTHGSNTKFTIEEGTYVRFTYSWKR